MKESQKQNGGTGSPAIRRQQTHDVSPDALTVLQRALLRPISFHPILARIAGDVNAGLLLSQALYWTERTADPDGYFWKTQDEWEQETTLSRREQESARRRLKQLGFLEEVRRGVPCRTYYRVCLERVAAAILAYHASPPEPGEPPDQDEEPAPASPAETAQPVCTNPPNQFAQTRQTSLAESAKPLCKDTETTSETTTETTVVPLECNSSGHPTAARPVRPNSNQLKHQAAQRSTKPTHPAVALMRRVTGRQPNPAQRAAIEREVDDLATWQAVLEQYALEGRPPNRVDWMLERYRAAAARASPQPEPARETPDERQARLRREWEAMPCTRLRLRSGPIPSELLSALS